MQNRSSLSFLTRTNSTTGGLPWRTKALFHLSILSRRSRPRTANHDGHNGSPSRGLWRGLSADKRPRNGGEVVPFESEPPLPRGPILSLPSGGLSHGVAVTLALSRTPR